MLKSMNIQIQMLFYNKKRILGQLILVGASMSFIGCKTLNNNRLNKSIGQQISSQTANNYFQGLLVYDPVTKDTLYNHNSQKYFTPASNTKIITLYTSLKTLPEKIPALKYCKK